MSRGSYLQMHYLSNFCCLCLTPNQNLKIISSEDNDGLAIEEKLKLFLFELINYKPYINKYVCNNCLLNVNHVYKFKLMCLKNMTAISDYVQKVEASVSNKNIQLQYERFRSENQNRSKTNNHEIENICLQSNMVERTVFNKDDTKETKSTIQNNVNLIEEYNDINTPEEVFIKTEIEETLETDDSYLSFNEDVQEKSQDVIVKKEHQNTCEKFQTSYETFKEFNEEKYIVEDVTITNNNNSESNLRSIEVSTSIACVNLLPVKTKTRYNRTYDVFLKWCTTRNIQEIDESTILVYFTERSEIVKSPASLWSEYSMLKLTISEQRNVDISKFKRLKAFLKRQNHGYQPRKSKTFTKEDIERFLAEAPDQSYLMMKIVAILGVAGSCRTEELHKMKLKDVELKDDIAIVKLQETRNNKRRSFVITNNAEGSNWLKLLQSYVKLRPQSTEDEAFFFRYDRGRCVRQVAGKHSISKIPREIAQFLKLDNVGGYTGHSFRKTLTTFHGNTHVANILNFKSFER